MRQAPLPALVLLGTLCAAGFGFDEVRCLCSSPGVCLLPIAQHCEAEDGCAEQAGPGVHAEEHRCPCGPCIDLPIASTLFHVTADLASAPVALPDIPSAAVTVDEREGFPRLGPSGESPPSMASPSPLRC